MTQIGFLSTYPPTRCGLATFTESLSAAMAEVSSLEPVIVRAIAADEPPTTHARSSHRVAGHLVAGDPRSATDAAARLNGCAVAVIQHEYGIFGGEDGAEVLSLLEQLTVPTIVVLHTVLASPTRHQRLVLEAVCSSATTVVVMTQHARTVLLNAIAVSGQKVHVIPHGARAHSESSRSTHNASSARLLTWGLISPGKGLEWSIRALAELRDRGADVHYIVAGQTHPKLVAAHGEAYRESLLELVADLDVGDHVTFLDRYLDPGYLDELLEGASVVLLPYESTDQATSGVLAEAVAARIPVIATAFPHAVELLSGGAGIVVPHRNPHAIADAVASLLSNPEPSAVPRRDGAEFADQPSWSAVAHRYMMLVDGLVDSRAA